VSSREIAQKLYLSPRTVRSRIERLRNAGVIEFTIRINRQKAGYPAADVVAEVEVHRVHEVAERITQFPEVGYVAITTGSQDISILVYGASTDDIHRFVMESLAPLLGVAHTNTHLLFKIVKECHWLPPKAPHDDAQ
jgi:Lrp/AsnC family transcriptional regulator, regulator for asnA, asnC and gidA